MDAFSSVPVSQIVTGAQKHPGDFAGAQATIDWHTSTRAELKANNFAEVLAGRVPATVRRLCTPVPVDTIYPVYAGNSYTPAQISARDSERARHSHENDAKIVESESQMRTLNDTASTTCCTFGCGIRHQTRSNASAPSTHTR